MRKLILAVATAAVIGGGTAAVSVASAAPSVAAVHCIQPWANPVWAHYLATHPGEHCPE